MKTREQNNLNYKKTYCGKNLILRIHNYLFTLDSFLIKSIGYWLVVKTG